MTQCARVNAAPPHWIPDGITWFLVDMRVPTVMSACVNGGPAPHLSLLDSPSREAPVPLAFLDRGVFGPPPAGDNQDARMAAAMAIVDKLRTRVLCSERPILGGVAERLLSLGAKRLRAAALIYNARTVAKPDAVTRVLHDVHDLALLPPDHSRDRLSIEMEFLGRIGLAMIARGCVEDSDIIPTFTPKKIVRLERAIFAARLTHLFDVLPVGKAIDALGIPSYAAEELRPPWSAATRGRIAHAMPRQCDLGDLEAALAAQFAPSPNGGETAWQSYVAYIDEAFAKSGPPRDTHAGLRDTLLQFVALLPLECGGVLVAQRKALVLQGLVIAPMLFALEIGTYFVDTRTRELVAAIDAHHTLQIDRPPTRRISEQEKVCDKKATTTLRIDWVRELKSDAGRVARVSARAPASFVAKPQVLPPYLERFVCDTPGSLRFADEHPELGFFPEAKRMPETIELVRRALGQLRYPTEPCNVDDLVKAGPVHDLSAEQRMAMRKGVPLLQNTPLNESSPLWKVAPACMLEIRDSVESGGDMCDERRQHFVSFLRSMGVHRDAVEVWARRFVGHNGQQHDSVKGVIEYVYSKKRTVYGCKHTQNARSKNKGPSLCPHIRDVGDVEDIHKRANVACKKHLQQSTLLWPDEKGYAWTPALYAMHALIDGPDGRAARKHEASQDSVGSIAGPLPIDLSPPHTPRTPTPPSTPSSASTLPPLTTPPPLRSSSSTPSSVASPASAASAPAVRPRRRTLVPMSALAPVSRAPPMRSSAPPKRTMSLAEAKRLRRGR